MTSEILNEKIPSHRAHQKVGLDGPGADGVTISVAADNGLDNAGKMTNGSTIAISEIAPESITSIIKSSLAILKEKMSS